MPDIPSSKPSTSSSPSNGGAAMQSTPQTHQEGVDGAHFNAEHNVLEDTDFIDENQEEKNFDEGEQEEPRPRFDEIDIMFYMLLAILGDIGDSVWVTRLFFAPATFLFLYFKGVDSMISKNAIAQFIEMVPVLGWLPISTTAAIITIFATNHPEQFQQWFGKAGEIIEKAGKIGKK